MEEGCCIPPIEFQTLVKYMPRHIESVLAACGVKTLFAGVSYVLTVCSRRTDVVTVNSIII